MIDPENQTTIDGEAVAPLSDAEFARFQTLVAETLGIQLGPEKKPLLYHRCSNLMTRLGLRNFSEYYDYIAADRSQRALRDFIERITTRHTYFYREAEQFDTLRNEIVPALLDLRGSGGWKIWCAACSSGEEAYTIAAILDDVLGPQSDFRILATDIAERALDHARAGIYSEENVNRMPENLRRRYFQRLEADAFTVLDRLRQRISFRAMNLNRVSFPLQGGFDIIFCRNVMIYLQQPLRDRLAELFHGQLRPGGYLFLGQTEPLPRNTGFYESVRPAVYRKPLKAPV